MGKAQSLRVGATGLLAGQMTEKACAMLRLMLLTHFIPKDEVGLASVFIVVLGFFDLITDLGVHNLLMHADDDADPRLLNAIHGTMFWRGAGLAAVMFLAAPWLAALFYPPPEAGGDALGGVAAFAEGLRWFAVLPLLRGLGHYDNNVSVRRQDYRPMVAITAVPPLVMLLCAYPVALYFQSHGRGYYAMMALIAIQEAVQTAMTHVMAFAKWRWHFGKAYLRRIFAFGTPLVLNGVFMFVYSLGDRALISSAGNVFGPWFGHHGYQPASWADYLVTVQLAGAPMAIVARLLMRLAIPLMAKARHDAARFAHRYRAALSATAVGAALLAVGLSLLGGFAATWLFSEKYRSVGLYMGPVALMQGLGMLKAVPTTALLACGDTRGTLQMTAWRASAIVPVAAVAALNVDIWWIGVCGAAGEVAALAVVYRRLAARDRGLGFGQWRALGFVVAAGAAAMLADGRLAFDAYPARVAAAAALCVAVLAAGRFLFPGLAPQAVRLLRGRLASDGDAAAVRAGEGAAGRTAASAARDARGEGNGAADGGDGAAAAGQGETP